MVVSHRMEHLLPIPEAYGFCLRNHDFQRPIAIAWIRQVVPASRGAISYPRSKADEAEFWPAKEPHEAELPHLKIPHDTTGEDIKGIGKVHVRDPVYRMPEYGSLIA